MLNHGRRRKETQSRPWTVRVCICPRYVHQRLVTLERQRCSVESSLCTSRALCWMIICMSPRGPALSPQLVSSCVPGCTFQATVMTTHPDSGASSKAMHWPIVATGLQIMCVHESVLGLQERRGKRGWSCACAHARLWRMHRRDPAVCSMHCELLYAMASCFT